MFKSKEELEKAKLEFIRLRPRAPKALVLDLWRHWNLESPDQPLFAEEENHIQNIALILHAKAYGETIPLSDESLVFARLYGNSEEWRQEIGRPYPPPGFQQLLGDSLLSLPSQPIMRAWVYLREDGIPARIIAVGKGAKELQKAIFDQFLSTSLTVYGANDDFLQNGMMQIVMPGHSAKSELEAGRNSIGNAEHLAAGLEKKAIHALQDLALFLKKESRRTGLIEVVEAKASTHNRLLENYNNCIARANDSREILQWLPKQRDGEQPGCASVPLDLFESGNAFSLAFHGDWLQISSFKNLFNHFKHATIDRTISGLRTRELFYKARHWRLRKDQADFFRTPPAERPLRWPEKIMVEYRIIPEIPRPIKLESPEYLDPEEFYTKHAQGVLEYYKKWFFHFRNRRLALTDAVKRPDSPLMRLAISRFLDSALRGESLGGYDHDLEGAFSQWKDQVLPVLSFEFRDALKKLGCDAASIGNPTTFFHTTLFRPAQDTNLTIRIFPRRLLFENETVVLFDPESPSVGIFDSFSEARHAEPHGTLETQEPWKALKESDADFLEKLKEILIADPEKTLHKIFQELTPEAVDESAVFGEAEPQINQAERKSQLSRILRALSFRAFQTSREWIGEYKKTGNKEKALIAEMLLEIQADGQDPEAILKQGFGNEIITEGSLKMKDKVETLIREFLQLETDLAKRLRSVVEKYDFPTLVRQIQHGEPGIRELLSGKMAYAVYLLQAGLKALKTSHTFEMAASNLPSLEADYEKTLELSIDAFEQLFLESRMDTFHSEALGVFSILTGKEKTIK